MPLIETKGAASAQGFGEFAKTGEAVYIESCFSTWLYTGNGSTQTITNGIDLSTKGGLVWIKPRTDAASGDNNHGLYDTARGVKKVLRSNQDSAQNTLANDSLTAFNATGFSVSDDSFGSYGVNGPNGRTFASWSFRKQAKFFDVVTWTGDSSDGRFISHSLGSVPGMVIVKNTSSAYDWAVWHRSLANPSKFLRLNSTAATATDIYGPFGSYDGGFTTNSACFTSTGFYVAADARSNLSGNNYVAYVFAHDAGGFGLTGTDNVISCGSFTTDGSGEATVTLGYEPQWALIKPSNSTGDWVLVDTMRSWVVAGNNDALLYPNSSSAEVTGNNFGNPTATGFQVGGLTFSNTTYIYIAIRRGPMKTPTTGTSVFSPVAFVGNGSNNRNVQSGFTVDLVWRRERDNASGVTPAYDGNASSRITGAMLKTNLNNAETATQAPIDFGVNNGVIYPNGANYVNNYSNINYINHFFRRAPGFFDVVCYTGTSAGPTYQSHNLGVTPELIIVKRRSSGTTSWAVGDNINGWYNVMYLNSTAASNVGGEWDGFAPTAANFAVGSNSNTNLSGSTYVAYLFASCPGVSKVTNFTGTGSLQTINCGFTGGARLVLIKRTDASGDWYVWDSARGISPSADPYLLLNSTAAEVTTTNWVATTSTGFQVTAASGNDVNINGASYIALAIA